MKIKNKGAKNLADNKRIWELYKELGISKDDCLDILNKLGIEYKNNLSTISSEDIKRVKEKLKKDKEKKKASLAGTEKQVIKKKKSDEVVSKHKPKKGSKPRTQEGKKPPEEEKIEKEAEKPEIIIAGEITVDTLEKVKPKKKKKRGAKQKKKLKKRTGDRQTEKTEKTEAMKPSFEESDGVIKIPEAVTVRDLAEILGLAPSDILGEFLRMGLVYTINQVVDIEHCKIIGEKLGVNIEVQDLEETFLEVDEKTQAKEYPRAPVITVMGHVDHGKTTLLDAIRKTNIVAKEKGEITQHIGASEYYHDGFKMVFLDTPGHKAFTTMRARGARVTDIVILVVAADDGVMPQTIEAINHAKAAEAPIIVAINKIDLPGADPMRVKRELMQHDLVSSEFGGDTTFVEVSAKKGTNMEELLEMIKLQAELMELKATRESKAKGTIIEAKMDSKRGAVATFLVQSGILKVGDPFVTGIYSGKVRAMFDVNGKSVKEAVPVTAVEVLGLSGVPQAGDSFIVVDSERRAREISTQRREREHDESLATTARVSLRDFLSKMDKGEVTELNLVLKTDVQGSAEALAKSFLELATEKAKVKIVHSSAGSINESDVLLASATNAVIIGFNTTIMPAAQELAEREGVDVRQYDVIYEAIDDVKAALQGLLKPELVEEEIGHAEIRQVFNMAKGNRIAGCMVVTGKIVRNAQAKLLRDGEVIWKGQISSLRRFKDDVKEVQTNYECGISLDDFNDIQTGDIIIAYQVKEVPQSL